MLTPKGKLYGDLTVACLADDHFMLFGSGAMQQAHRRWFEKDLPDDVTYCNRSDDWHGIALSGPKSRMLLARLTRDDVGADSLKFRDLRQCFVAGVPVILNRISFSGELGFEIYCHPQYLLRLAEALRQQVPILAIAGMGRGRCCQCGWKRAGACGRWNIALISMRLNPAWTPLSIGTKISLARMPH